MKWDCGETWDEYKTRMWQWHRRFLLRPRRVSDHDCRWLEYVERRGIYRSGYVDSSWEWEYRALDKRTGVET